MPFFVVECFANGGLTFPPHFVCFFFSSFFLPPFPRTVAGDFPMHAAVSVRNGAGVELARGIVNYDSAELGKIKGLSSKQFEAVLGYCFQNKFVSPRPRQK
jgi:glutamate 5-kinase